MGNKNDWRPDERLRRQRFQTTGFLVCLSLLLNCLSATGQPDPTSPKQPPTNAPHDISAPEPGLGPSAGKPPLETPGPQVKPDDSGPLVRLISPELFQVGSVRLDKKQRTVSFPAVLNSSSGPMEYLLVTSYGKVHESILKTDAVPYHIHIAMLLLGVTGREGEKGPSSGLRPRLGPIKNPSKETLPGDRVWISVSWKLGGAEVQHPVEELVFNQQAHAKLEPNPWVYNGSAVIDGRFLAQVEGSIVSLVTDPVALLNNTGPGHDNDQIWTAATNNLPPAGVPLEVRIKLPDSLP